MKNLEKLKKKKAEEFQMRLEGAHKDAAMTNVMLQNAPIGSKPQYIRLWSLLRTDKLPLFEKFYKKVLPPGP